MNKFQHASIKSKLTYLLMSVSVLIIFMACLVFIVHDYRRSISESIEYYSTIAEITGNDIYHHVLADGINTGCREFSLLIKIPEITRAAFLDNNDSVLCSFKSDSTHAQTVDYKLIENNKFANGYLYINKPIYFSGNKVGSFHLKCDASRLQEELFADLKVMAVLLVIGFAIVAFASAYLKRLITEPLHSLTRAAQSISENEDYSIRIARRANDEIGRLVQSFNGMLAKIQERDSELNRAHLVLGEWADKLNNELAEHKKIEDSLRVKETKYRTLFDMADDAIFLISNDKFIDCNRSTLRIFDCTRDQIINQSAYKFSPELQYDGRPSPDMALERMKLAYSGQPQFFEWLHCKYDGTLFDAEVSLSKIELNGEVCLLATVRDITKRKQTEKALKYSAEILRPTIESTADGILVVDDNGKIVLFNQRFAELWCIPQELLELHDDGELLNYALDQLKDPRAFLDKVTQLYGTSDESRDTLYLKDERVFERYTCPLVIDGKATGRVWNFRDVTEKLQSEKQKTDLKDKLERARRMESLGILAGGVAHDLNNMLGPMVGYPELILRKLKEDDPIRKQVVRIGKAAQDAADVIQDLLMLARRGRYEMTPINLNRVIRDYLDSPSIDKLTESNPGVKLNVNLDDQIGPVMGSAPHLSKVIMNLIINAFDAVGETGSIEVSTEQKYLTKLFGGYDAIDANDYVIFHVEDSGNGIKPEDLTKIFEPYYSKKKMDASGSGLGLSVVYGIVKDHKGFYDVFSTVGQGTEFVLYIPLTKRQAVVNTNNSDSIGGHEKLLVVDDSSEQRDIATALLSTLGYRVDSVPSGRAAVEYILKNPVDLVILDMIMENDFDGLDTYREILKNTPDQKAIIVSGFSSTERVQKTLELGAGKYIRKPYTRQAIGRAVRDELDKSNRPELENKS